MTLWEAVGWFIVYTGALFATVFVMQVVKGHMHPLNFIIAAIWLYHVRWGWEIVKNEQRKQERRKPDP